MNTITQEFLKDVLHYDESSGDFYWKKSLNRKITVGKKAGCIRGDSGYISIGLLGKSYFAHRLAWLYVHGYVADQIDHINHERADNRICNLRSCTTAQNRQNSSINSKNTSGHKGVSFCKRDKKWRAYIKKDKKYSSLGYFDDVKLAIQAYATASKRLFGEFANAV